MRQHIRCTRLSAIVAALFAVAAVPAFALYPQLSTSLVGPAINGVTPQGDAKVDQSKLPSTPGQLQVRIKNVNLPDGTVLTVNLGNLTPGSGTNVATIVLRGGQGQVDTALPQYFMVGRQDQISILNGGTVILSGGAVWKV
jgi:hypothetical protein